MVKSILDICTTRLQEVTPHTLTHAVLSDTKSFLDGIDIQEAIDQLYSTLPLRPEDHTKLPEWEQLMHARSNELNKAATAMNKELSRLKEMQAALIQPQLADLIHAAQNILRPVYNFTAQLSV